MGRDTVLRLTAVSITVAGAILLTGAAGPAFNDHSKAYYLRRSSANFIRPGLVIKVTKADIASVRNHQSLVQAD